jgi:hypothetical protein
VDAGERYQVKRITVRPGAEDSAGKCIITGPKTAGSVVKGTALTTRGD